MDIKEKLSQYIKENKEETNILSSVFKRKSKLLIKEELSDDEEYALEEKTQFYGNGLYKAHSFYNYEEEVIDNYINENKNEETFQSKLFSYIDKKELKDSDVYNKVHIDRRLFSKIRGNKDYHPSKETIILLGIALELNESEIVDFLESASYSLPKNSTYDLIIRFCFKEKIYNLNTINDLLYDYKCKPLIWKKHIELLIINKKMI